jgi:hypothetical protein
MKPHGLSNPRHHDVRKSGPFPWELSHPARRQGHIIFCVGRSPTDDENRLLSAAQFNSDC